MPLERRGSQTDDWRATSAREVGTSPREGASIVALWDADSRYTALKAGYDGGASLAEFTIPVLAFLPFGVEPPKKWRELGDQRPTWWAPEEVGRPLPGERTAQAVGVAHAAAPKKATAKTQKQQAELARTHEALFDVELTAGGDDALLTPTLVSRTEALVTVLLDSETYQAQLGGLARKPQQEQVHRALAALLDAGGTLPVTRARPAGRCAHHPRRRLCRRSAAAAQLRRRTGAGDPAGRAHPTAPRGPAARAVRCRSGLTPIGVPPDLVLEAPEWRVLAGRCRQADAPRA